MGNILIIEDEGIISLDVKETLKSMGFAVETAAGRWYRRSRKDKTKTDIQLNNS